MKKSSFFKLKNRRVSAVYIWAIILNIRMGLRYAELHGLKWEDIYFSERTITVKDQMVLDYDENLMKEETLRTTMLSDGWQDLRITADHLRAS